MYIGIKTSDNDFHHTWISVLNTIHQAYKKNQHHAPYYKDRDKLTYTIKRLAYPHYLLFQQDPKEWNSDKSANVEKYLDDMPIEVLIDQEVDDFMQKHWGYNHSFFVLDTRLYSPKNSLIYSY